MGPFPYGQFVSAMKTYLTYLLHLLLFCLLSANKLLKDPTSFSIIII